jgi:2-keto-3-deoxy-L-rhamnonate aldolase RhmA
MLVEHRDAVACIEEIFDLPIDFCWIGLHDLSASMGIDPHSVLQGPHPPALAAAIDRVRTAARAKGVHYWAAEPGADASITGVDARIVRRAAEAALAATRERLQA